MRFNLIYLRSIMVASSFKWMLTKFFAIREATCPRTIDKRIPHNCRTRGFSKVLSASWRVFKIVSNSLLMILTKTLKIPLSLAEPLSFAFMKKNMWVFNQLHKLLFYRHPFPKEFCVNWIKNQQMSEQMQCSDVFSIIIHINLNKTMVNERMSLS